MLAMPQLGVRHGAIGPTPHRVGNALADLRDVKPADRLPRNSEAQGWPILESGETPNAILLLRID